MITDEEFLEQRKQIESEIEKLEQYAQKKGEDLDWLELAKQAVDFATYAGERFESGNIKKQRSIAKKLGSNFVLRDKNLEFEMHPVLQPFVQGSQDLKEVLELIGTPVNTNQNEAFASLIPIMGTLLSAGRTFFEKTCQSELR